MDLDLLIRGGTVVNAGASFDADVGIRDHMIVAIASPGELSGTSRVIDANGLFVLPGGVDQHVHTALRTGEFTSLDDFYQSARAGAYGGTTTIVDFAIPQPPGVQTPLASAEERIAEARATTAIDVAFHGGVTRADDVALKHIPELYARGLPSIKMFTVWKDTLMLSLEEVLACLESLAIVGGIAFIHAESPHIVEPLRDKFIREGRTSPIYQARSRPPESEIDMVRSIIELLKLTGAAACIVHVTTPAAAFAIINARASGVKVWAETCPQYVFLDETKYLGGEGELYVCSPPLRDAECKRQMWDLVAAGAIDVWASDHCCYDTQQKRVYKDDFSKIPNGLPGIETRGPLLFSEGVVKGRLSPSQFVALASANPAKLNGLYPRKGVIAPGSDADIAIYDPNAKKVMRAEALHMKTDYTPFEGFLVQGWPRVVLLGGQVILNDGEFLGSPGSGRILLAGPPQFL